MLRIKSLSENSKYCDQHFEKNPAYRKRIGEGVLKAHEKDPTIKVRLREIIKEYWQNPDFRESCIPPSMLRRKQPAIEGSIKSVADSSILPVDFTGDML